MKRKRKPLGKIRQDDMQLGEVFVHSSGFSYKIVYNKDGVVKAVFRKGRRGRWGEEIVQVVSRHLRGFRRVVQTMQHRRRSGLEPA